MILSLANSRDLLNRTLETANQAWSENTALTKEAELRYATTQSQLTMMQNAYNNLKIAIGDNFTPTLSELYGVSTNVLSSVTEFVEKNPELVKAVTAFTGDEHYSYYCICSNTKVGFNCVNCCVHC